MVPRGTIVIHPEKTLIETEGRMKEKHITNILNVNIRKFNPAQAVLDNETVTKMLKEFGTVGRKVSK